MMVPHGVDPAFSGTHGGNDDKVGNNREVVRKSDQSDINFDM